MALYAIGDLHLSLGADKPMDVFGGNWDNYVQKITEGFSALTNDDTCVICGDVTWGMSMEESLPDFKFIDSLPGKKIILKGNHDYWWSTVTKARAFFEKNGISTIDILNNNAYVLDCDALSSVAVCGTRGWFSDEEAGRGTEHDRKIMAREAMRLDASLSSVTAKTTNGRPVEKLCFLHYPPLFRNYICREIIDVMNKHDVKSCWYGHIHGIGHKYAVTGEVDGIDYHMVSADYIGFSPVLIC